MGKRLKVGLIKGGQLGLMLLEARADFDVDVAILDDDPKCPCRGLCDEFVDGDSMNFDHVYAFGKRVDLLSFEYEHINIEALRKLKAEGLKVYPDPDILSIVQDKGTQKEFYKIHQIPTSPFVLVRNKKELAGLSFPKPYVLKTRKAGYDGKGVLKINCVEDLDQAFDEPCVVEEYVDFAKEISVVVARNPQGEIAAYPTVEMVFHPTKNLVEFLASPANISKEIDEVAQRIALDLAVQVGLVGVLAVEMFVDRSGKVLVNEIAPRVHNSGHHTIEANVTSQFAQHWRAILGLPLGSTAIKSPAVMVNVLGNAGYEGKARYEGIEQAGSLGGVYVHLYGKDITRPFRKMGHATVLDTDTNKALAKAQLVKTIINVKA